VSKFFQHFFGLTFWWFLRFVGSQFAGEKVFENHFELDCHRRDTVGIVFRVQEILLIKN
jgi:hypothetical protein